MILYKIFRYLFFVLYFLFIIFFFVPQDNVPAFLTSWYEPIRLILNNQNSSNEAKIEEVEDRISQLPNRFFVNQWNLISVLDSNISFEGSLEQVLVRQFSDIAYLINNFLGFSEYFRDVIIYENDEVLFKYSNNYDPDYFAFQKFYNVRGTDLRVEYVFDKMVIQEGLNRSSEDVFVSFDREIYYSFDTEALEQEESASIFSYAWGEEEKFAILDLSRRKRLFAYRDLKQFNRPFELYMPVLVSTASLGFHIFISWVIFIAVNMVLFFLDNLIVNKIKNSIPIRNSYKKNNKLAQEEELDANLSWLESFIKIESHLEKDVSKSTHIKDNSKNKQ